MKNYINRPDKKLKKKVLLIPIAKNVLENREVFI